MHKIIKRNKVLKGLDISADKLNWLMESEEFPKPIKVGKISGWLESEIDAWIESRVAERDAQGVSA